MRKRPNKPALATQLALFPEESTSTPEKKTLARPIVVQKTEEVLDVALIKQTFMDLGKYYGYPHVKYLDPRTTLLDTERREVELFQGLDAWRTCLGRESIQWLASFNKWLEAGKFCDSVFIHMIRKNREDMLLHYAMLKHYPEMQIADYLVGGGEAAWQSAAKALDRETLETTIHLLVEGGMAL
jgi:hypothetical protein